MKRRVIIISAIVLIVIVVAGVIVLQNRQAQTTAAASVQTATVRRGSLAASVSAAGNVIAPNQMALAFQASGTVAQVNVGVGSAVKKDQVLEQLDLTDLNLALQNAQTNLASAQANYDQTKADLNFALRTAQASVMSSKANLDAAVAKNAQNPNSLTIAKVALDKATVTLQQAQGNYNKVAWRPDIGMAPESTALQTATIDYQTALAAFNLSASQINDNALKSAQAQYTNDQTALEQAQKNMDTKLRVAQAQLDDGQVSLEQAKRNIEKAKIIAPFDGIAAVVNYAVGDSAASSTAVTVVDMSNLQIKVTIAEVDLSKVKLNQTAQVTFDALPGKTYNAKVLAISPSGTVTQGVVNYPILLQLTDADAAVKPGMTSNLSIEVDRRDNVLLIPTRAVRTQGTQKMVTVLFKGQSIPTQVGTGLSNDQSIEITSGLQEGDVVVINQTTTRPTGGGGGGFGVPFLGR